MNEGLFIMPTEFEGYKFVKQLGKGGFGTVGLYQLNN